MGLSLWDVSSATSLFETSACILEQPQHVQAEGVQAEGLHASASTYAPIINSTALVRQFLDSHLPGIHEVA